MPEDVDILDLTGGNVIPENCIDDFNDDNDEEENLKIKDLHLSYRTTGILTRFGITDIHQLNLLSDEDLWIIDGMTRECYEEIQAILRNLKRNSDR